MSITRKLIYLTKYIPFTKFYVLNKIKPLLINPILDLGCHIGDTFYYMKFSGQIIGVDIHSNYFAKCRERAIYQKLVHMNLLDLQSNFGTFGSVTCFFVLEHLAKKEGHILLNKMKQLGKNNIVMVPLGFRAQECVDGNPFQRHLSSWMPEDLLARGFEVYLCTAFSVKRFPGYTIIIGVRENV